MFLNAKLPFGYFFTKKSRTNHHTKHPDSPLLFMQALKMLPHVVFARYLTQYHLFTTWNCLSNWMLKVKPCHAANKGRTLSICCERHAGMKDKTAAKRVQAFSALRLLRSYVVFAWLGTTSKWKLIWKQLREKETKILRAYATALVPDYKSKYNQLTHLSDEA